MQDNVEISRIAGLKSEGNLEFETGYRVALAVGSTRQFSDRLSLRLELESGFFQNGMSKLSGPGGSLEIDGTHTGVPVLVNFVLSYAFTERLSAFAGVGGGLVVSTMDFDKVAGLSAAESDTEALGAFQWTLGVGYALSDKFTATLAYKGIDMFGTDYSISGVNPQTEASLNHSILAGIGFKF